MKIAILNYYFFNFGGGERVCVNLAAGLKKKGHQVEVFSVEFCNDAKEMLKNEGIPYRVLPFPTAKILDCRFQFKIAGWVLRNFFNDFDVINVHSYPAHIWTYYAKRYAKHPFPKLIWICHEPARSLYPEILFENIMKIEGREIRPPSRREKSYIAVDKLAAVSYDTVYCNSQHMANKYKQIYGRDPIVNHFGVNLNRWGSHTILPLPEKPTMVTISRLEKPKNIQSVLLAVARAVKKDPRLSKELRFKIGGKGSYLEELKKLSSSLGINHLVEFCGFISDDQIPAFFMQGSFTIFVPIDEPMGLIPIESGLFGRATLGANQGGVPELIKDNQTGILVDPQNIDAIADQIVKLCNDRELAVRLGENARKDVLKNFNFDDFVEDFERRAMS